MLISCCRIDFSSIFCGRLVGLPFFKSIFLFNKISTLSGIKGAPELPTAQKIRPQFGSSPNKAVLSKSDDTDGVRVKSPIIGTAYLASEPGGKKFIEVGSQIKKGQTVMIVEAMKTMNHVPSTAEGVVKKVLVQDGQAVEFGQALVLLK